MSFEILPLVEFVLDEGITDREAMNLIESSAPPKEKNNDGGDVFTLDDSNEDDPFTNRLIQFQQEGGEFQPVVVNQKALLAMEPGEVIVCKWDEPLRYQWFKNLMPDMSITKCETCNKVFHTDDYELQLLQKGYCPFCRAPAHFIKEKDSDSTLMPELE